MCAILKLLVLKTRTSVKYLGEKTKFGLCKCELISYLNERVHTALCFSCMGYKGCLQKPHTKKLD